MASPKTAATWLAFGSIAKRQLSTLEQKRAGPRRCIQGLYYHQDTRTEQAQTRKSSRCRPFDADREHRPAADNQESEKEVGKSAARRTASNKRVGATNSPLRKAAVEAQRSRLERGLIRGTGRRRHVVPEAETRDVTAYCAADVYNLYKARDELEKMGYDLDPYGTRLFPQVLHLQTPNYVAKDEETGVEKAQGVGDLFVFPSGCVVAWNVPEKLAVNFVHRFLAPAAGQTAPVSRMEAEDLEYIEDPTKEASRIIGDTIILGTKPSMHYHSDQLCSEALTETDGRTPETDRILAKIAFSSALARSTKLAVLENSLNSYFTSTRSIPHTLASGKPVRTNRSQILQKTGELLLIRAQLNLYSELTDSLPDLFWDSPHELGLEGYYEMVGKALDVGIRIKALNEKMDYASEIAAVLRERLSEKHSTMLEWMIIGLICIEVGFGIVHLWRESAAVGERKEERHTRALLDLWLETELSKTRRASTNTEIAQPDFHNHLHTNDMRKGRPND